MLYAALAIACLACALAAWRFPALRGYALAALGILLSVAGLARWGTALKDRASAGAASRKELAASRKQERATVADINAEVDELNEEAAAAVSAAEVEEALERVAPTSEEERAARIKELEDAI